MTINTRSTYKIKGGRIGVLLFHALCGTPSQMRYVAHGLARAGYTVHCPLLAGHGGSPDDLKATRWQDWLASAEAALDEISAECDQVICAGLSTGALLSLMLAARHPEKVTATALLAPTLWLNGWGVPWYARLFRFVRHGAVADMIRFPNRLPHGIKDDRIRQFVHDALRNGSLDAPAFTPGRSVLEHRRLVAVLLGDLGRISQPALIMHPREDDYAALDNAFHLQRGLAGSVEMVVLDDSYHIVTLDRQRHVVVERMLSFLERAVGALAPAAAVRTAATA